MDGAVFFTPTFPLESIRIDSVPPSLNAIVSAAGKKMPVLVSPVGTMAGEAAVPVPLVIRVVEVRVGMTPVVIVPVVELSVVIVPEVKVAAVPVVVPAVKVGMVAVVIVPVVIVPVVIVAAVEVVVPAVSVVMVPVVNVAAVPVVVPSVAVSIVPVVTLAVGRVWAKLATVMRFRLLESEASPIKSVSLVAVMVSAVRS